MPFATTHKARHRGIDAGAPGHPSKRQACPPSSARKSTSTGTGTSAMHCCFLPWPLPLAPSGRRRWPGQGRRRPCGCQRICQRTAHNWAAGGRMQRGHTSGRNSLSAGVFQTGQEPPGWPCMPFNPKVTGSIPVRPTSRPPGLPPAALPCSRPVTPTGRGTSGRTSGSGTRRRSRRPARATRGSCWAPCRWCLRCASGTASASRPLWDPRSTPPSRRE